MSQYIRVPTPAEIEECSKEFGLQLSEEEIEDYLELYPNIIKEISTLREYGGRTLQPKQGETRRWGTPTGAENPNNEFVVLTDITNDKSGILDGYRVGLKDNISVAGVPMTCGSSMFWNYTPASDATVVTRMLNEGASIVGKLNMEDFAFSGSGEISANGPTINPNDSEHLAGGSSSGSAAAVVSGQVDMSLGTDQGGSVRVPAAICGCVGLKPTFGLVPYTGIVGLGPSFDHVGPLANTVSDCAVMLDAIAGCDQMDPRQQQTPHSDSDFLSFTDPGNITLGRLEEGFGDGIEPAVSDTVDNALDSLQNADFEITDSSIPLHDTGGPAISMGVMLEEITALFRSEGVGYFMNGYYDTQFADYFSQAIRLRANELPQTLKLTLSLGQYLKEKYQSRFYFKANNLRPNLRHAYDTVFDDVDVLVMPTTPKTAHKRKPDVMRTELLTRGMEMSTNTVQFNMTGHPAISLPCGDVDGLPVGMMIVAPRGEDRQLLQIANKVERTINL